MKSMLQHGAFAATVFFAIMGAPHQAQAQTAATPSAPTPAQAQLIQILTTMGYSPAIERGLVKYVTPQNYTHYVYVSSNGNTFNYIPLKFIPIEKQIHIPYAKLMEWAASRDSFFTKYVSQATPPIVQFAINQVCGAGGPDAVTLLKCTSTIEADADASRTLWDSDNWK